MNAEECRQQSLERLQEMDERFWSPELFKAGSFGCHEALHMASMLSEQIGSQLLEHAAIIYNPEWYQKAWAAQVLLQELYQEIGAEHLGKEDAS